MDQSVRCSIPQGCTYCSPSTLKLYEVGLTPLGICILQPYIGSYRAIRTSEGASRYSTSIWRRWQDLNLRHTI
ncbi:hypothetical protein SeF3a_210 [Salmonella phage SeF3a]|nr:hypothetical protein SeF3a_210 [Salmonella phage SeF3a]